MKTTILAFTCFAALAPVAFAAPDSEEINDVVKDIKTVRDVLVPEPIVRFVESFPPIAIPRQKILQLAQGNAKTGGGGGSVTVSEPAVDTEAITEWANNFANATTKRTFDALFPKAAVRRPVIVGNDTKNVSHLEEDLTVMMRILEKAADAREDGKPTAMGIDVFSFGGKSSSPRAFYLDGYGAMFVLNVKYPLVAPPKKDEHSRTNEQSNSDWERAREEVYGRRGGLDEIKFAATGGEEFDADRVESLKTRLIDDLVNARNIRHMKSDDYLTVVVLGGGTSGTTVVRRESRGPRTVRGGGGVGAAGVASVEMSASSSASADGVGPATSTMTLRAKKSDIDAFANGKLDAEAFRKKISVQAY